MSDIAPWAGHSLDSFKKIDRLWFDDADVVFCAGKCKFRVSRLILSAQSPILRDMFSLPHGVGDTVATKDNLPYTVITLQDTDRDVYHFFMAIFDASYYSAPPSTISVTLSILRLAHKYEVRFLVLRAIKYLDDLFPLDLETLDRVEYHGAFYDASDEEMNDEDSNDEVSDGSSSKLEGPKAQRSEEYMEALPILDSVGADWLIPALLFVLVSRYRIEDIMKYPIFDQLSFKHRLLIVRSEINYAMEEDGRNSWLNLLPSPNCAHYTMCAGILRTIQGEEYQTPPRRRAFRTPASISVSFRGGLLKLCQGCQGAGAQYRQGLRQKFWNEYWVNYGFESRKAAMDTRAKKIAEMEMGIAQFEKYDFND